MKHRGTTPLILGGLCIAWIAAGAAGAAPPETVGLGWCPGTKNCLQWSGAPQGTVSFVLTFHDADTAAANSTDGLLHWVVWNIPATAANIAQGQPDGFELENGMRQISVSGFRYRGPGAPSAGPLHHYLMELYALDTMLDIKLTMPGPQEPNPNVQAVRTSIMQAMAGHVRGKGAYVGLFHR